MMKLIYSVLLCHFIAAFAALGMPLFLPYVLPTLGAEIDTQWAGVLFILPTLCTAAAAGFWGRFADKRGKRLSLLRAQLGLAMGFTWCGLANDMTAFIIGLMIQGTFGGTMAASNAYLSSQIRDKKVLGHTLNKTQLSARLALIIAPVALGGLLSTAAPLNAYLWLAGLPLVAFSVTLSLPADQDRAVSTEARSPSSGAERNSHATLTRVFILQWMFAFAMVVTFPYFAVFADRNGIEEPLWIGVFYAFPHLVYLLVAGKAHHLKLSAHKVLTGGFCTLSVAGLLHLLPGLTSLIAARLLFGLAIVLCYHGLHQVLSHSLSRKHSGHAFSKFDAMSKWGGVAAGGCASYFSTLDDVTVPFLASSLVSACGFLLLTRKFKEWDQNHAHSINT